jgi:prolyl-tRNA synthetase
MKGPDGGILVERRGIEVGNIFQLGYHYTNLMEGAEYTDQSGHRKPYYMGCYGIGIGRTLAAIVEAHSDERGIVWPEAVAPFRAYIARLGDKPEVLQAADKLYDDLTAAGVAVIYDDRDVRAGEKFADADLIGIPYRVVISEKSIDSGHFELKLRSSGKVDMVSEENVIKILAVRSGSLV